jgi:hypothetical protein
MTPPPPMSLDELRAAAERVLRQPYDLGTVPDAVALATWVRDLLNAEPFQWVLRRKDGASIYSDGEMRDALYWDTKAEATRSTRRTRSRPVPPSPRAHYQRRGYTRGRRGRWVSRT